MFDYLLKLLPNGRVLVRKSSDKSSVNLKPSEIAKYLETEFSEVISKQEENETKLQSIREEALRKL